MTWQQAKASRYRYRTHQEQEQQQHQQKQQGPAAVAAVAGWPVAVLIRRTIPIITVRTSLLPQLTSSAAAAGEEQL